MGQITTADNEPLLQRLRALLVQERIYTDVLQILKATVFFRPLMSTSVTLQGVISKIGEIGDTGTAFRFYLTEANSFRDAPIAALECDQQQAPHWRIIFANDAFPPAAAMVVEVKAKR